MKQFYREFEGALKVSQKRLSKRHLIAEISDRRPYGSKVKIILSDAHHFGFDGESCLLLSNDLIIRLIPQKNNKFEVQNFTAIVEGFATATEAEQAGLRFAMSVLWAAVSLKCPLRLEYHTPLPCVVYDRMPRSELLVLGGGVSQMLTSSSSLIVEMLEQTFDSNVPIDQKLLVSMELFAAARLEATERTRFVGLVSALEPLAEQEKIEQPALLAIVENTLKNVRESLDIPSDLKPSLEGRIQDLTRESVSQAINRLLGIYLQGDTTALKIVREAYSIRSKILHEGSTDADLSEKSSEIEDIIRRLYSAIVGYELRIPAVNIN